MSLPSRRREFLSPGIGCRRGFELSLQPAQKLLLVHLVGRKTLCQDLKAGVSSRDLTGTHPARDRLEFAPKAIVIRDEVGQRLAMLGPQRRERGVVELIFLAEMALELGFEFVKAEPHSDGVVVAQGLPQVLEERGKASVLFRDPIFDRSNVPFHHGVTLLLGSQFRYARVPIRAHNRGAVA